MTAGVACQLAHEHIGAETGEHEGREKEEVVAENRVPREGPDRQRLQRLREEVLGIRKRVGRRMEDVGVPIPREGVQIAGDEPPQVIRAPGDDP